MIFKFRFSQKIKGKTLSADFEDKIKFYFDFFKNFSTAKEIPFFIELYEKGPNTIKFIKTILNKNIDPSLIFPHFNLRYDFRAFFVRTEFLKFAF